MNKIKEILKFHLLPKKIYLHLSARNKFRRADSSQESELRLLPKLVNKHKLALDVGANTGLYTYFLSKYAKEVIAFEPHVLFVNFLKKAVADNVVVINKGVSNKNGLMPFHIPVKAGRKQMNIATFDESAISNMNCITKLVETLTLDSMQLQNVGFIKIDVEGHEYEVLEGANELISGQKPVVQIEILGQPEEKAINRSLKYLREHGYDVYVYHEKKLKLLSDVDASRLGKNFICIPV